MTPDDAHELVFEEARAEGHDDPILDRLEGAMAERAAELSRLV